MLGLGNPKNKKLKKLVAKGTKLKWKQREKEKYQTRGQERLGSALKSKSFREITNGAANQGLVGSPLQKCGVEGNNELHLASRGRYNISCYRVRNTCTYALSNEESANAKKEG